MKHNYKYYLIYKITNLKNNRIYVGMHRTNNLDDNYMGSSKLLKQDIKRLGRENFTKEVLHVFNTPEEMALKEAEIVNGAFVERKDTYNRHLGGEGSWYHLKNTVVVRDNGKTIRVSKTDPRYLSGELKGVTKGKVSVKDSNGETMMVSVNDPRYISGELVGVSKGTVTVKDIEGNKFRVNKDDSRYISGELIGHTKGLIIVKDKNGNHISIYDDDPRYLSGELVSIRKKLILVEDESGKQYKVHRTDKRYQSGVLKKVKVISKKSLGIRNKHYKDLIFQSNAKQKLINSFKLDSWNIVKSKLLELGYIVIKK